jgi:predicted phage terminase large subunit-like protein
MPEPLSLLDWAGRVLEPAGQAPARHHIALLDRLQRVSNGSIDRLMVLMPPGSAKSTYASLIFPAWWMARHPATAIIAASHTADLAAHFGRTLRNLIAEHSDTLGYDLARDSRAAQNFRTTTNAQYFATGIDGPVTGRRADLILIDDPIKSHNEADSAAHRDHLWNWYRTELSSRLKPGGRIVLIMTSWHQDDISARLLASGDNWTQLRLPAIAEANDPIGRAPGDPLWPAYEDAAALSRKREAVGSRVWQALYQQSPVAASGSLFPVARIATLDAAPDQMQTVRAWDMAATEASPGRDPDWTVGLKLGRDRAGRFVVLDVVRLRAGPNETVESIVATAARDGDRIPVGLAQDPGQAGKQQVAWLTNRLAGYQVIVSPETGSKLLRATPVAACVEAGALSVLRAGWTDIFLDELAAFPGGRKDDQVDALSRAHAMLNVAAAPTRRLQVSLMQR